MLNFADILAAAGFSATPLDSLSVKKPVTWNVIRTTEQQALTQLNADFSDFKGNDTFERHRDRQLYPDGLHLETETPTFVIVNKATRKVGAVIFDYTTETNITQGVSICTCNTNPPDFTITNQEITVKGASEKSDKIPLLQHIRASQRVHIYAGEEQGSFDMQSVAPLELTAHTGAPRITFNNSQKVFVTVGEKALGASIAASSTDAAAAKFSDSDRGAMLHLANGNSVYIAPSDNLPRDVSVNVFDAAKKAPPQPATVIEQGKPHATAGDNVTRAAEIVNLASAAAAAAAKAPGRPAKAL